MSYTLHCGDNVAFLKDQPTSSVQLTVTSPPYDNLRTYNGFAWDCEKLIDQLYWITKPGGVVVWVVADATVNGSETGTSFKQALSFIKRGFNLHDTMIWEKTGSGALGSQLCYGQNFEFMFVFSKGKPSAINLICDRENVIKSGAVKVNGSLKSDKSFHERVIQRKPFGKRTNLWKIQPQQNSEHPAPFPEAIAADHIASWSNSGDTVLDPFLGSGTTGKMAVLSGRNFIGCDISSEYVEMARTRIDKALSGDLLAV